MPKSCDSRISEMIYRNLLVGLFLLIAAPAYGQDPVVLSGELKKWHRVGVKVTCPETACGAVTPTSDPNPFTNYRLIVNFTSPDGSQVFDVPGFYAGDGDAAYTESDSGNVWMAYFTPDQTGEWSYDVSFQSGTDVVLHKQPATPIEPDGSSGVFTIAETDKSGNDFRSKGFLKYANSHFYYFTGTGKPFLKNGAGSPENILHYHEFSNTFQQDTIPVIPAHEFAPHIGDFNQGDPLWGPDKTKGKGVIGALNYLSTLGVNSYYFIVNNTSFDGLGQGTGVWPWIAPDAESRDRFSVTKLAEWEVVFSHMDSLGISMNLITQDRINQWDLDNGELGRTRQLFYRELIARYGHHPGVVWNLGEENSATTQQIIDYTNFIRGWDVYDHPIVSQANGTLDAHDRYYTPLLGFEKFEGASMQVGLTDFESTDPPSPPGKIHESILKWVNESRDAGHPWVVMLDEIGHWSDGIVPDGDSRDPTNRRARREGFWGTLMAGGAGSDWYFGSDPFEYNDIWTEDFTVREEFFKRTRDGVDMIINSELPYWEMINQNEITSREDTWVLGKDGEAYFVYSPFQFAFSIFLPTGDYDILWYDAFAGGPLQEGTITSLKVENGPDWVFPGAPIDFAEDAVAVITVVPPVNISNETENPAESQTAKLHQNYPNPVRQETTLTFELGKPTHVELTVYDTLGRKIKVVTDQFLTQGTHQYEVDFSDLPSGLYFYRLDADDDTQLTRSLLRQK